MPVSSVFGRYSTCRREVDGIRVYHVIYCFILFFQEISRALLISATPVPEIHHVRALLLLAWCS